MWRSENAWPYQDSNEDVKKNCALRRSVSDIHIAIKCGNMCHTSRHAAHNKGEVWSNIMKRTNDEYWVVLLSLGTCSNRTVPAASGRARLFWSSFRRSTNWAAPPLRTEYVIPVAYVNPGRRRTAGQENRENVTWYNRGIGTTQPKGPRSITWRATVSGLHICLQTIILYQCNYANGYDMDTTRLNCFYIMFCAETKFVLRARDGSTSTTATSEHGIILALSANVDIKSSSASESELSKQGTTLQWTCSRISLRSAYSQTASVV
jgi:hypothetical protein